MFLYLFVKDSAGIYVPAVNEVYLKPIVYNIKSC